GDWTASGCRRRVAVSPVESETTCPSTARGMGAGYSRAGPDASAAYEGRRPGRLRHSPRSSAPETTAARRPLKRAATLGPIGGETPQRHMPITGICGGFLHALLGVVRSSSL